MRLPKFWHKPPMQNDWRGRLLAPLGRITAAITARRVGRAPRFLPRMPVICLGNLNVGGSGKTPAVIAFAQYLQGQGYRPFVLSRGYGGRLRGPLRVEERTHKAHMVGDEPLLLAAFAPVVVAQDRAAAAQLAQGQGADVLLMDDGFQNPSLRKDFGVVVVDASLGFGNGRCLPAGPLREPVARGLARADLLLSIGAPQAQAQFSRLWGHAVPVPRLEAALQVLPTGMDWQNTRCLAFAGIGNPDKFFATLRSLGADVAKTVALADHQPLSRPLLQRLSRQARAHDAQLITTEKDAVRLPCDFRSQVLTLPVRLHIHDMPTLAALLAPVLKRYPRPSPLPPRG